MPSNGPAAQPVDMTRFREFAEVARFFRIEAESRLPGASRPKGTDVTDSGQAATAGGIYRDPGRGGTPVPGGASRGRGDCRCPPRLRLPPRGMVHPLGASPDPRRPEPCLTFQRGTVARRADGVVGGRPIVPRRPRASSPPRRWSRRSCGSPRIRGRRTVLPSGSSVGVGADQVAIKAAGRGFTRPVGEMVAAGRVRALAHRESPSSPSSARWHGAEGLSSGQPCRRNA
jgi:hypothetical protein